MSAEPNRCANCPRVGSLFSPAPGQPATLCGLCAHEADPDYYRRAEGRRADDTALCAELARTRRALAAAEQEVRELRRKLRNAHDANAALYDYTGGRAA